MGWLWMFIYRALLPLFLIVSLPSWLVKMIKRGGWGRDLFQRLARYEVPIEYASCGVVYVHAVSVGEVQIALKWLSAFISKDGEGSKVVLAVSTSTGYDVAERAIAAKGELSSVTVIYAPIDLRWLVKRAWNRYEPRLLVLVESEVWPNLLQVAKSSGTPIMLLNARLSDRSHKRYQAVLPLSRWLFANINSVLVQTEQDVNRWQDIGVEAGRIEVVGSVKYDPHCVSTADEVSEYREILNALGAAHRPVVMALSTHDGEEAWIASALEEMLDEVRIVLVPRHMERRLEVMNDLSAVGCEGMLRSEWPHWHSGLTSRSLLIVDSTGELRDWTALADVAIVGKSLLARGGQNPCEAIMAGVPVIAGEAMGNFADLVNDLIQAGGIGIAADAEELRCEVSTLINHKELAAERAAAGRAVLDSHQGATQRSVRVAVELLK